VLEPANDVSTTHDLGDVEAITERVMVIHEGQLIFDGPNWRLRQKLGQESRIVVQSASASLEALKAATELEWADEGHGRYSAGYDTKALPTPELVARVLASVPVEDLELRSASMEDVVRELYERCRA
jgi:ABC-2 type transport system ATP-binding protein